MMHPAAQRCVPFASNCVVDDTKSCGICRATCHLHNMRDPPQPETTVSFTNYAPIRFGVTYTPFGRWGPSSGWSLAGQGTTRDSESLVPRTLLSVHTVVSP